MTLTDLFLFVVLPYAAVGQLLPAALFYRRTDGPVTEPSGSPSLASERDSWTSRAAWSGAAALLLLHLLPFVFGGWWGRLIAVAWRLLAVELAGLAFGLVFVAGIAALLLRRLRDARLTRLRTALELSALAALLFASIAGVATAVSARWGSAWYTHVIAPYLWSLAKLRPDVEGLSSLGFWPRAHLAFSFLAMALVPFTTLPRQLFEPVRALLGSAPAAATGGAP